MPLGKIRTIAVERRYYGRFRSAITTLSDHKCTSGNNSVTRKFFARNSVQLDPDTHPALS
jgi:hypothetical protein